MHKYVSSYTYTYIYIYIYIYSHIRLWAFPKHFTYQQAIITTSYWSGQWTQKCTTDRYVCMYVCMHVRACVQMQLQELQMCKYGNMYTLCITYIHIYMRTYIHTYIHTRTTHTQITHTHVHTYIYTHVHTLSSSGSPPRGWHKKKKGDSSGGNQRMRGGSKLFSSTRPKTHIDEQEAQPFCVFWFIMFVRVCVFVCMCVGLNQNVRCCVL